MIYKTYKEFKRDKQPFSKKIKTLAFQGEQHEANKQIKYIKKVIYKVSKKGGTCCKIFNIDYNKTTIDYFTALGFYICYFFHKDNHYEISWDNLEGE